MDVRTGIINSIVPTNVAIVLILQNVLFSMENVCLAVKLAGLELFVINNVTKIASETYVFLVAYVTLDVQIGRMDCPVQKKCPGMCVNNTCQRLYGHCKHGCEEGYSGPKCQYSCSRCLAGVCDPQTVKCADCKPEYFGTYCEVSCGGCIDGTCTPKKGCTDGCIPRRHGTHCEGKCGQNCFACEQDTGICQVCKTGYTGQDCKTECASCTNEYENGTTSFNGSCSPGHYGLLCDKPCNDTCGVINGELKGRCYKYTGQCINSCKAGYYGKYCQNECGKCNGTNVCNSVTGKCPGKCSTGYFTDKCSEKCPENCKDNVCYHYIGACLRGCREPYEGINCAEKKEYRLSGIAIFGIVIGSLFVLGIIVIAVICIIANRKDKSRHEVYFENSGKENSGN